jgi:D-amino-acid oxidase
MYLPWLVGQCLAKGAVVKRGVVRHVSEAADLHHSGKRADIVINCTGLSSIKLGGVEDKTLYPARGQTVVVRNDPGFMVCSSGTDDGPDEATYVMNRAAGESQSEPLFVNSLHALFVSFSRSSSGLTTYA